MNQSEDKKTNAARLRSRAETNLERHPSAAKPRPVEKLLHELQVYQIELEMQNESLRAAQCELEASRDRYLDLFDFAPVGYLTLNTNGMIEELNLTAATLFGMERTKLLQRSFLARVLAEDQPRWVGLLSRLKAGVDKDSVELGMQRGDGTVVQALLDCERRVSSGVGADKTTAQQGGRANNAQLAVADGDTAIRVVLTDISRRKDAETAQGQQTVELTRFNRAMVGREMAMIELKRQVNALSLELRRASPFALEFNDAPAAVVPR